MQMLRLTCVAHGVTWRTAFGC